MNPRRFPSLYILRANNARLSTGTPCKSPGLSDYPEARMFPDANLGGLRFATEDALTELHRVIKPAGVLGMIWNVDSCKLSLADPVPAPATQES